MLNRPRAGTFLPGAKASTLRPSLRRMTPPIPPSKSVAIIAQGQGVKKGMLGGVAMLRFRWFAILAGAVREPPLLLLRNRHSGENRNPHPKPLDSGLRRNGGYYPHPNLPAVKGEGTSTMVSEPLTPAHTSPGAPPGGPVGAKPPGRRTFPAAPPGAGTRPSSRR